MEGKILGFEVSQSKSLDIDSNFDFKLVEYLMKLKDEKK